MTTGQIHTERATCWDCKHFGPLRLTITIPMPYITQSCVRPCGKTFSPVFGWAVENPKGDCSRERRRTLFDKLWGVERCGPEGKFFERKAQAIEARRAETLGSVHESAVHAPGD